jgi:hypothetical protein
LKDQQSPDEFDDYKLCAMMITGDGKPVGQRELLVLLYNIRERIWARQRRIREAFQKRFRESISKQEIQRLPKNIISITRRMLTGTALS